MSETFQMPNAFAEFRHAEDWYLTKEVIDREGARPITTANFAGLNKLSSISNLILYHPLFGKYTISTIEQFWMFSLDYIVSYQFMTKGPLLPST